MSTVPPAQEGAPGNGKSASGLMGAVEKLLAATAVLGATLYVLVNALYIDFYDGFGVRPEQVGLDRVAVLARSAWVALVAIALLGPVAFVIATRALRQRLAKLEQYDSMGRDERKQ